MRPSRHALWGPFVVRVSQSHLDMGRGWEDCPLPNGEEGWCVYLEDRDRNGSATRWLPDEAIAEIREWLLANLDVDNEWLDDNVYVWGVTFEHQADAFLCYMRYR